MIDQRGPDRVHSLIWGWDIKFPDAAKKTVSYKTPDRWKITRLAGTWKLYVNDAFVGSAQAGFVRVTRLEIDLPADNAPILVGDLSGTVLQ